MPSKTPSSTAPTSDKEESVDASRMSIGDHLDELRVSLIRAMIGVAITTIGGFVFGKEVLGIILKPLLQVQYANGLQPNAQVLSPSATFVAYLKVGFLTGLIVASPWILYQIWRFIASGLYRHERRFMKALLPGSIGLFGLGVLFLYYLVLPLVLNFFITFNKNFELPNLAPAGLQKLLLPAVESDGKPEVIPDDKLATLEIPVRRENPKKPQSGEVWVNSTTRRLIVNTPEGLYSAALEQGESAQMMRSQFAIDQYISFVLMLALAFGIAFETPIIVYFLARTGIVTAASMRKARRYVFFGMVVMAAVLTPPDVISQLMLAGPMYLLFELGLILASARERKTPVTM